MPKKHRLLICCEGETERQYVMAVAAALRIKNPPKVLNPAASDPMGVLAEAYKEYCWSQAVDPVPYTEIWLLFDRDHHPTYGQVFKLAPKLGPEIHLCWTNPCIEFWFWLHYSGDAAELKFDDELELSCKEETVDLGNHVKETRRVRRVLQTIKPETMLSILKKHCAGYSKVHCPQGLVTLTLKACDHLQAVAQSEDPMRLGSAMPDLLLRLARLAEETLALGAETAVADIAPAVWVDLESESVSPVEGASVTEAKEEASEASNIATPKTTEEILKVFEAAPADHWKACVTPLRNCLEDWKQFEITAAGVSLPQGAVERLEQFFQTLKTAEESMGLSKYSQGRLETLAAIRQGRKLLAKPERIEKMRLQLRALGDVLRVMAKRLGLQEIADHLDFTLQSGAGLLSSAVATNVSALAEDTSLADAETPVAEAAPSVVGNLPTSAAVPAVEEATAEAKELPVENASETSVAPEASMEDKTNELKKVLKPLDPWQACAASLLNCLGDWEKIRVTAGGITVTNAALDRLEKFFRTLRVAEESNGSCKYANGCLDTLEAIRRVRNLGATPKRIQKMQRQLRSLGVVMRLFVNYLGLQKSAENLDFLLIHGTGLLPADAKPVVVTAPVDQTEQLAEPAASEPTPETVEERPSDTKLVEVEATPVPEAAPPAEEPPEEVLKNRLADLKELRSDIQRVMKLVVLNEGEPPQEMMPGLCAKAACIEKKALSVMESCLEILAGLPAEA